MWRACRQSVGRLQPAAWTQLRHATHTKRKGVSLKRAQSKARRAAAQAQAAAAPAEPTATHTAGTGGAAEGGMHPARKSRTAQLYGERSVEWPAGAAAGAEQQQQQQAPASAAAAAAASWWDEQAQQQQHHYDPIPASAPAGGWGGAMADDMSAYATDAYAAAGRQEQQQHLDHQWDASPTEADGGYGYYGAGGADAWGGEHGQHGWSHDQQQAWGGDWGQGWQGDGDGSWAAAYDSAAPHAPPQEPPRVRDPSLQGLDEFFADGDGAADGGQAAPAAPSGAADATGDPRDAFGLDENVLKVITRHAERAKISVARKKKRDKAAKAADAATEGAATAEGPAATTTPAEAELARAFPTLRKALRREKAMVGAVEEERAAMKERELAILREVAAARPAAQDDHGHHGDAVDAATADATASPPKRRRRRKATAAAGSTSEIPQIRASGRALRKLAVKAAPAHASVPADERVQEAAAHGSAAEEDAAPAAPHYREEPPPARAGRRYRDVMMESIEAATDTALGRERADPVGNVAPRADIPLDPVAGGMDINGETVSGAAPTSATHALARPVKADTYSRTVPPSTGMDIGGRCHEYLMTYTDGRQQLVYLSGERFQPQLFAPLADLHVAADAVGGGIASFVMMAMRHFCIEHPTPIQRYAIPLLLEGHSMYLQSPTGSGKTLAYAVASLRHVRQQRAGSDKDEPTHAPVVIISTPNKLAGKQVYSLLRVMKGPDVRVWMMLDGDASADKDGRAERMKYQVLITTHNELQKLMRRDALDLSRLTYLVFDEPETMPSGYANVPRQMAKAIAAADRKNRALQLVMCSATLGDRDRKPASWHELEELSTKPLMGVRVGTNGLNPDTYHAVSSAPAADAMRAVVKLFESGELDATRQRILICVGVSQMLTLEDQLRKYMQHAHGKAQRIDVMHGGRGEESLAQAMKNFRQGYSNVLISSSHFTRALDVPQCTHVVVVSPRSVEEWVHTVGRCARAGRMGRAHTILTPEDFEITPMLMRTLREAYPGNPALDPLFKPNHLGTVEVRRSESGAYSVRRDGDGEEGFAQQRITIDPDVFTMARRAEEVFRAVGQRGTQENTIKAGSTLQEMTKLPMDGGHMDRFDKDVNYVPTPLVKRRDLARQVEMETRTKLVSGGYVKKARYMLASREHGQDGTFGLMQKNLKGQQVVLDAMREQREMEAEKMERLQVKAKEHNRMYRVNQVIKWRERTGISDPRMQPALALPRAGALLRDPGQNVYTGEEFTRTLGGMTFTARSRPSTEGQNRVRMTFESQTLV